MYISINKETSKNKEKKILKKFEELDINFDEIVHLMFNSICSIFLPIDIVIDLVFIFLFEGQKSLFRFLYSTLKMNKSFIINLKPLNKKCRKGHVLK